MIDDQTFDYIDVAFAKALCKKHQIEDQEVLLFFSKLLNHSRQGHLCLKLGSLGKNPLDKKIKNGAKKAQDIFSMHPNPPLFSYEESYYLERNWICEEKILYSLKKLINSTPKTKYTLTETYRLDPLQKKAIETVFNHSFSLITGGPGSGKTYVATLLIETLLKEKKKPIIIVAAPTGKALYQLKARLSHLDSSVYFHTLHSLLKVSEDNTKEKPHIRIFAELLIVDEASMIDAPMMERLLSAVFSENHTCLMGDSHQLPSIENGACFADFIRLNLPITTHLNKCYRSDTQALIELKEAIKESNYHKFTSLLSSTKKKTLNLLSPEENLLCSILKEKIQLLQQLSDPHEIFNALDSWQILSPKRYGPLGIDKINQLFRELNNTNIEPIIVTKTDHTLELQNGTLGFIKNSLAYFKISNDTVRTLDKNCLSYYETSAAISIHKAQGSEFSEVIFALSPNLYDLDKSLLYTAITRAKSKLILLAHKENLLHIISNTTSKESSITEKHQQFFS